MTVGGGNGIEGIQGGTGVLDSGLRRNDGGGRLPGAAGVWYIGGGDAVSARWPWRCADAKLPLVGSGPWPM